MLHALLSCFLIFFFLNDTATTEIYTLSLHDALPIFTSQKRHDRVQMSPRIMIVSARRLQHSPMFGQLALSHTVLSCSSFTMLRTSKKVGLVGIWTRIHSGWRRLTPPDPFAAGAGSPAPGETGCRTGRWTRSDMAHALPRPGRPVHA